MLTNHKLSLWLQALKAVNIDKELESASLVASTPAPSGAETRCKRKERRAKGRET